jgi:uncharacterized membrane protein
MENTQKIFTIEGVLKEAFAIIKSHFWTIIGQFTLIFLCYLILSTGFDRIFLLNFTVMVLYIFVVTVFSLSYANKGSFHFDDLLHALTLKRFCYFVAAFFLFGLAVIGGMILLIIPGIIVAVMLGYYKYEILEKEISPLESLKASRQITKGYRWKIFAFMFVSGVLVILGILCVFVGILFFLPLVMIADAIIYKKLSAHAVPAKPEEVVVEEAPKDAVEVEATSV